MDPNFETVLSGKLRRLARATNGESPRADRRGWCRGCGDCCQLAFRCQNLSDSGGCLDYENRSQQCRGFPYGPEDLVDVRLQHGSVRCSYHFHDDVVGVR